MYVLASIVYPLDFLFEALPAERREHVMREARVNGFVYSPLLKKTGFEYHGLVHVSDWFP